jgi:hypothetical protein
LDTLLYSINRLTHSEALVDEEQFYAGDDFADAEFYDGPTGDEGKPYMRITESVWLRALLAAPESEPAPPTAPEPVWDKPLLTAEEFMAKYGLKGPT